METATVKKTALLASVVYHLKAPAGMKTYRVARHHWAQTVLSTQKQRTNLVTLEQAKSFDNTDNQQLSKPDLSHMYVQAPVQDRNDARVVALSFISLRTSRAFERRLSYGDNLPMLLPVAGAPGMPDSPMAGAGVPDSPLVDVPESPSEASLHAADYLPNLSMAAVPNSPLVDVPESPSEASLLRSHVPTGGERRRRFRYNLSTNQRTACHDPGQRNTKTTKYKEEDNNACYREKTNLGISAVNIVRDSGSVKSHRAGKSSRDGGGRDHPYTSIQ
jgi:hypothetical protein